VGDAEIEKGACITFDVDAAFVEVFRSLDIALLELLGALFQTLEGLGFCGVRRGGVGGCGSCPTLERQLVVGVNYGVGSW